MIILQLPMMLYNVSFNLMKIECDNICYLSHMQQLNHEKTPLQGENQAGYCQIEREISFGEHKRWKWTSIPFFSAWIKLLVILQMTSLANTATVFMTLSSTNNSVGVISDYTITFNRSKNALGQTVTASPLQTNHIMNIIFDPSYAVSSGINIQPSASSVSTNTHTVSINLVSAVNSVRISSFQNPLPSQTALPITINFYNSSNPSALIDSCAASLTFQALSFASSSLSYTFEPGNVSSPSNMTISMVPFIWDSTKMLLNIHVLTFWTRNLLNVTANQVIGTNTYCSPACSIQNRGSFFVLEITGLTLVNNALSLKIFNILSPATLEIADTVSISTIQTTHATDVQTGTMPITSTYPNNMQILTPSTTSLVGQAVSLTLTIKSQDLFSATDNIQVVFNTNISMAATVAINNPLVSTFSSQIQQNFKAVFDSFILVTSIPSQFSGSITINDIQAQQSVQPVTGNVLSFYRNGALYDQSTFSFEVQPASMTNVALSLASDKANQVTNLTITSSLSFGLNSTDQLYIRVDQAIEVHNCSVLSCSGCVCTVTTANVTQGVFYSSIKVTSFPVASSASTVVKEVIVMLGVKNPISSGYTISATTTSSQNFTKQTGSAPYPAITQSTVSSSIFTLTKTVDIVYSISNYTIVFNFAGYSLVNGWMLVNFDSTIVMPDITNPFCLVNGNNGQCIISLVSGAILANITISSSVSLYTVQINNLRNPDSTRYFNFQVQLTDTSNVVYYTLTSPNYRASIPYTITPQATRSNCTNFQSSTLTVTFPFTPFQPSNGTIVDDSSAPTINGQFILNKLSFPIMFASSFSTTITNSYSLQPVYYKMLVKTSDFLYDIFDFTFQLQNCNPAALPVLNSAFTGLPQDPGTLSFTINQIQVLGTQATPIKAIQYLTIQFPSEFSTSTSIISNAVSTTQISPRLFNLTIGNTQPISIQLWNFTSTISSAFIINTYALSQSGSDRTYQVSTNTNSIAYNLALLTSCTFPCKICSNTNTSQCLQCYSSAITQQYFLDQNTKTCVTPQTCSSNTFANTNTSTCILCPVECSTCVSSVNCTSCAANYYLHNTACITDCPSGFYPINPSQVCGNCSGANNTGHCSTCLTINSCTSCQYPYYLQPSSKLCAGTCSSNEVVINSTCFSCYSLCLTCIQTTTNCTSCVSGYYLHLTECISACPAPFVPSNYSNICVSCSTSCLTCTIGPFTCTSCSYPLKLMSSVCVNDCPTGTYTHTASNNTLQCIICPSQCTTCSSASLCQSCQSTFYFYTESCLVSCPQATFPSNQTVNGSLFCSACSSFCLTCTSSNQCSQCQSGYYISPSANGNYCASVCASGQFLNGNTCENCSTSCINCVSSTICLVCVTSTFLQNAKCVSNCTLGSASQLKSFTYINANLSTFVCQNCSTIYSNCDRCTNVSCTSCQAGYIYNIDSTCVVACANGYLNVSGICVVCRSQCVACVNLLYNCSACASGFVQYYNSTTQVYRCLTSCPSGTYDSSGVCSSCLSPCLTCITTQSNCLTCMSTFLVLNSTNSLQCVSQCPSNAYAYQSECRMCNSDCILCDGNGCTQCAAAFYHDSGQNINGTLYYLCYAACPTTLPHLINTTCSKCASNCRICNTTDCIECHTGWVGFGQNCLTQCPPGMSNSNGICIVGNATNNTSTPIPQYSTSPLIPIPFSIIVLGLSVCILISKYIHTETIVSVSVFATVSMLAAICNIFYMMRAGISPHGDSVEMYVYILVVGVIFSYVNNVIYIFVAKHTLLKDEMFIFWKRGNVQIIKEGKLEQPSHEQLEDQLNAEQGENNQQVPERLVTYQCFWRVINVIGILTSHNLYAILFSKLFGLSVFKAYVRSVRTFHILNYLWVASLIAFLFCFVGGVVKAASIKTGDSNYLPSVYESTDLIFVNFVFLLMGFLLLKKKKDVWTRQDTEGLNLDDEHSTKKVIFDHQNNDFDMNNVIESQEEVNGKIKNLFNEPQQIEGAVNSVTSKTTNQQASDLYFDKPDNQNLDQSTQIKFNPNNIFMQIGPDQMEPDLVEKGEQEDFSGIDNAHNSPSPVKSGLPSLLEPEGSMDFIDLNALESGKRFEETEQNVFKNSGEEEQFNFDEQGGNRMAAHSPSRSKNKFNDHVEDENESNRTSGQLIPIEQEAEGMEGSRLDKRRKKDEKSRKSQGGRASKTLRINQKDEDIDSDDLKRQSIQERYGAKTIKPEESISSSPDRKEALTNNLDKREIKTQQGKRRRRDKQDNQDRRYRQSPSQLNKQYSNQQSARMSGLQQMFNSYQATSSPALKVAEADKKLKNSPLKIVEGSRYQRSPSRSPKKSQKDKKQGKAERISSSAQNLKQLVKEKDGDHVYFEEQLQNLKVAEEEAIEPDYYNHRTIAKQRQISSQSPQNRNIFKSQNTLKFNDRLKFKKDDNLKKIDLRAVSRDDRRQNSNLKPEKPIKSVAKYVSTSKSRQGLEMSFRQTDRKGLWKSKIVPNTNNNHENLGGTAHIIERKSKLANSKAQLEQIYTPSK